MLSTDNYHGYIIKREIIVYYNYHKHNIPIIYEISIISLRVKFKIIEKR